jgi:hypothetical protein
MRLATLAGSKSRVREIGAPVSVAASIKCLVAALLLLPAPVLGQALQPGAWDVTSTVVDLTVPGVPGFIQRMIKGKSKAERKQLAAGQGIEALLVPDPKARCRVDDQRIAGGRYSQTLSCPQKKGDAMNIVRAGTYDAVGFDGRATVRGTTAKGPVSIILDQRARRKAG